MTIELNGWSFECVKDGMEEVYLRSRAKSGRVMFGGERATQKQPRDPVEHRSPFDARLCLAQDARRRNSRVKRALVAAALLSALLAVTFPTAHASWLKWSSGFGTTAMSDDLAEAKALTKEACGDNSQWGQELCENAKRILIAVERRAT